MFIDSDKGSDSHHPPLDRQRHQGRDEESLAEECVAPCVSSPTMVPAPRPVVKIYFNGKLEPAQVLNDTLSDTVKTTSPLLIGGRDGSSPFDGDVADARFYNRLLAPAEIAVLARGAQVRTLLKIPTTQRSPEQLKTLTDYVEATDPDLARLAADVAQLKADRAALEMQIPDTMVMEELPKPRDTFVLLRGQYDKHGDKGGTGCAGGAAAAAEGCAAQSGWGLPGGLSIRAIRSPLVCRSIDCGKNSSALASSKPARISGRKPNGRPIPNCWIGWRRNLSGCIGT